jgi:hypothetical protein
MNDISGSLMPAGVELTIKYLLGKLKWLETAECRAVMDESVRVAERKVTTDKFKNMLMAKEFFTERMAYGDETKN